MSEKKYLSAERNSITVIFAAGSKERKDLIKTPGPLDYDTLSKYFIGDQSSVKATIGKEIRPLTARPELSSPLPGPQDYKIVNTDIYKKNKQVIRRMTFPKGRKV